MTSHKPGDIYFGEYVRFSTSDKKVGAALAGPDNAVGDIGTIEFVLDDSKRQVAWLKNPYGQLVGFLNNHDSYNAAVMAAKGWELHYVLSFTAYSEEPEPGEYWGQVALIAFAPRYAEEFNVFLKAFAKAAGDLIPSSATTASFPCLPTLPNGNLPQKSKSRAAADALRF